MSIDKAGLNFRRWFSRQGEPAKNQSVVETTDVAAQIGHYSGVRTGEKINHASVLLQPNVQPELPKASNPGFHSARGSLPMHEISSRYAKKSSRFHARIGLRFGLANLSLFQKILLANLLIILAGAIIGSWLTAGLAQAGQFNPLSFSLIIITAVSLSGATSYFILRAAFRPFHELQKVIDKIHTGNSRARAALHTVSDPDVRHFTAALNQMLARLEENARIIQEDQRQLQLMTAQVINAQENERKRIARELHDEASQSLTAIIMGLESAWQDVDPENRILQAKFDGLRQLAVATLEELRKLALDLRPTMLDDLGLLPAVRWLSRTAAERGNLEIKVKLDGFDENERLASEVETCLFRITQECLTNITRHAAAKEVKIKLERVASFESAIGDGWGAVRLTVIDDGRGFRPVEARHTAYQGGHLGLFDIEERVALLGGLVQIDSRVQGEDAGPSGTKTTVLLPLSGRSVESPGGINTNTSPYTQLQI